MPSPDIFDDDGMGTATAVVRNSAQVNTTAAICAGCRWVEISVQCTEHTYRDPRTHTIKTYPGSGPALLLENRSKSRCLDVKLCVVHKLQLLWSETIPKEQIEHAKSGTRIRRIVANSMRVDEGRAESCDKNEGTCRSGETGEESA